jgi:carbonic anhydrase
MLGLRFASRMIVPNIKQHHRMNIQTVYHHMNQYSTFNDNNNDDQEVNVMKEDVPLDIHAGCNHNIPLHDKNLLKILEQNEKWRSDTLENDPKFFDRLGSGHDPKFLWIGCADARVPANELMGEPVGNVFVHRNVGNQVLNTDIAMMSSIQYAVDYLKVPHIIVCGHYDCGAVNAASENKNHQPPLELWLTSIRDVKRMHRHELNRVPEGRLRARRLVELNVIESCLSVFKHPSVQQKRVASYKNKEYPFTSPQIHALVFDPSVGRLEKLNVDFKSLLVEHAKIYDIHGKNSVDK